MLKYSRHQASNGFFSIFFVCIDAQISETSYDLKKNKLHKLNHIITCK